MFLAAAGILEATAPAHKEGCPSSEAAHSAASLTGTDSHSSAFPAGLYIRPFEDSAKASPESAAEACPVELCTPCCRWPRATRPCTPSSIRPLSVV
ncbi:hypothetical protein C8Q80DRAFT_1188047 [Daedaleopsis nitida]|nr:hypothetical protein C8Q80DRAFT_1188047 [Daedaleopsis nitida]